MVSDDARAPLSSATRAPFHCAFAAPTEAQRGAGRAVAAGRHALAVAPRRAGRLTAFPAAAIGESGIPFGSPPLVARAHHGVDLLRAGNPVNRRQP